MHFRMALYRYQKPLVAIQLCHHIGKIISSVNILKFNTITQWTLMQICYTLTARHVLGLV